MHNLLVFVLLIARIASVFSSKITQICGHKINEDGLPIVNDRQTGSPLILKQLAESDEIIHALVQRYYFNNLGLTDCQRHLMQQYLSHFESSTGKLTHRYKQSGESIVSRAHNVAWNPIATFLMMRRFRFHLLPLAASLNVTLHEGLFSTIASSMNTTGWPSAITLNASIDAVLRIQQVHDLATTDIANGKLDNVITGLNISPEESFIIAERALNEGKLALAIEWFEQALAGSSDHQKQKEDYVRKLEDAINTHDSRFENSTAPVDFLQHFFTTKVAKVAKEKRIRQRTQQFKKWGHHDTRLPKYWGLCTGKTYQTEEEKSRLFCYYESSKHPWLTIGPIKTEVLTSDRIVVLQYYDLLNDGEIKKLQREASTGLQFSTIGSSRVIDLHARSSLEVLIEDNFRDDIKIGRIVEMLTKLKVRGSATASEKLKVVAYASGSHYVMHYDTFPQDEIMTKNMSRPTRIATFMFYLSDVVKGGGTPFTKVGVVATPVKGSAVLWFNVLKSSELDESALHGSCPIVIGEKWIANKWIHYHEQGFQPGYQCEPDFEAKFKLDDLVNNVG